jgi:hypothetical protein
MRVARLGALCALAALLLMLAQAAPLPEVRRLQETQANSEAKSALSVTDLSGGNVQGEITKAGSQVC